MAYPLIFNGGDQRGSLRGGVGVAESSRNTMIARWGGLFFLCLVLRVPTADAFCFDQAATEYRIPKRLLMCIAARESSFNPAAININRRNSIDVGTMQINSSWYYRFLSRYGAEYANSFWDSLADPCFNVRFGAWVLYDCIRRHGHTWEAVGCYNATSPEERQAYAWKIHDCITKPKTKHLQ